MPKLRPKPIPVPRRPRGRPPAIYNHEIALAICTELASGTKTLNDILTAGGSKYPGRSTVYRWAADNPDFAAMIEQARLFQIEGFVDDMITLADDKKSDVARSALQIKTRQWLAGVANAKKYGAHIDHNHTTLVQSANVDVLRKLTADEREVLRSMLMDAASRPDPDEDEPTGLVPLAGPR